jgi:hypothetical protein
VHAETQLKMQLKLYTEKYEEFQQVLDKSNKDFITFRNEMDKVGFSCLAFESERIKNTIACNLLFLIALMKMTKKIKKLELETHQWKLKWENCNKSLLHVTEQVTD